jgi:hypothetical protein
VLFTKYYIDGYVALLEHITNSYKILVGKSKWNRPRGRPRCKWEGNIKADLKEMRMGLWTGFKWLRIRESGRF